MQFSLRLIFYILLYVFFVCLISFGLPEETGVIVFYVSIFFTLTACVAGIIYLHDDLQAFCIGALVPTSYVALFFFNLTGPLTDTSQYFRISVVVIMLGTLICGFLSVALRKLGQMQSLPNDQRETDDQSMETPVSPFDD